MNADERREQVLDAAMRAFARSGYAGTSTDAVAKEAGVSQPYVVRMFGTKAELFRSVFARALDSVLATFEAEFDALDANPVPDNEEYWQRLGRAYGELIVDRDLLLVMMHGFTAGATPEIGAQARSAMTAIYRLLRDRSGADPDRVRSFIAEGMLLNVLLAMQAPENAASEPALGELCVCAFGDELTEQMAAEAG
ncbi:MAG TPA: TetR/AcrR family transcriptional regulator [Aldersonia sp.]